MKKKPSVCQVWDGCVSVCCSECVTVSVWVPPVIVRMVLTGGQDFSWIQKYEGHGSTIIGLTGIQTNAL